MGIVAELIAEHQQLIAKLIPLVPTVEAVAEKMVTALQGVGSILWMGNGGSAADAQHLAAELVGRFQQERRAYSSIALTTNSSIVTAVANDYGYEQIFARQVEGLCRPGDVVVGISTSGNSRNVVLGIEAAKQRGAFTVGMVGGSGGELAQLVEECLLVPSTVTARIQEAHILLGHILCQVVETTMLEGNG